MAVAVLCWLRAAVQAQIDSRVSLLCTSTFALIVVVYVNLTFNQSAGRYLFSSIASGSASVGGVELESLKLWSRRSTLITASPTSPVRTGEVGLVSRLRAVSNLLILTMLVVPSYRLPL